MSDKNINSRVATATKWSAVTEIVAKLVTPVTSMLLARLLTPEAFGVVTTLAMIISFGEIFADAGFQKYLVQHEFVDDTDREQSTNVAFWSNFAVSLIIWGVIALFAEPLATLVGNPGLGHVLTIACVSIPLSAFSSIQMSLYRRDLDFKTLFKVRIISIVIPLVVTVPLALWLRSFWALVIGTITQNAANAILLTLFSKWKPRFFFSFHKLHEMLSFTIWSLIEAISIWLTMYIDVFIVSTMLNQYYLGLYKAGAALVGQIIGLITSITTPILFSSLSRLQDNNKEFIILFMKFQKYVALLVLPIGVLFFCYSDLITQLLLGEQWFEASMFIGLWGLTSAIGSVLSHNCSEVYRAKGRPKLSVLVQWSHIIVLWPIVFISVKYGFEPLCISRSLIRFEVYAINLAILYKLVHISPILILKNISSPLFASIVMGLFSYFTILFLPSILWQIPVLVLSVLLYLIVIMRSPDRYLVLHYLNLYSKKVLRNIKTL